MEITMEIWREQGGTLQMIGTATVNADEGTTNSPGELRLKLRADTDIKFGDVLREPDAKIKYLVFARPQKLGRSGWQLTRVETWLGMLPGESEVQPVPQPDVPPAPPVVEEPEPEPEPTVDAESEPLPVVEPEPEPEHAPEPVVEPPAPPVVEPEPVVVEPEPPVVEPEPPVVEPVGRTEAELPRVYVKDTGMAEAVRTVEVSNSDDLHAALAVPRVGDHIVLHPEAEYRGTFQTELVDVVVRSSVLMPKGERMRPLAHAHARPKVIGMEGGSKKALDIVAGSARVRLVGLEIMHDESVTAATTCLDLSTGASEVTVDRCYVHGHDALTLRRGILMHATAASVIDSWVSQCHAEGADAQAIIAWETPGPLHIENCHLEGSGENVMFGGATPSEGVIPSDIVLRRNHFFKPLAWLEANKRFSVKNLFEIKIARRVLLEHNVFENNWVDAQDGDAINIKSNVPGRPSSDVTFGINVLRNSRGGLQISNVDRTTVAGFWFEDIEGRLFSLSSGSDHLHIIGNAGRSGSNLINADGNPHLGFVFTGNAIHGGKYGIKGSSTGTGTYTLRKYFPDAVVTGNALVGQRASSYPAGNTFPLTLEEVEEAAAIKAEALRATAGVVVEP